MKKLLLFLILLSCVRIGRAQETVSPLTISGYVETYYVFDFNKPSNNTRPDFIYSYNRHNEVNLNLGILKMSYLKDNVRSNFALMAGTYANANLAKEPGVLKNIYEANIGVKLSHSKNLWVDAGIFTSHIGFESAIGKDCWNLTRSILAENSPYYESGVKVSYTSDNNKWFLSGLVLNGWQHIQRVSGSSLPSFGTQVTFKPSSQITINSSTFIGTDTPDSARLMRYFHNFYGQFQLTSVLGLIAGFDYGLQQKSTHSSSMNIWYSPVLIMRMALTNKLALAVRGEYYADPNKVMIYTSTPHGFKTFSASVNLDYQFAANVLWRSEIRNMVGQEAVFLKNGKSVNSDLFASTSLAISF